MREYMKHFLFLVLGYFTQHDGFQFHTLTGQFHNFIFINSSLLCKQALF